MTPRWIELVTGPLEQKKRYRRLMARLDGLPEPYRAAAEAVHRYLMVQGGITEGETLMTMLEDLTDLWERAAVDDTPVRDIVGDDPVEFVETFAAAYSGARWIDKERGRLVEAIEAAERRQRE